MHLFATHLLACGGTPAPGPIAAAPDLPFEATPTPPTPPPPPAQPLDPRIPEPLRAEIQAHAERFAAISDPAGFAASWRAAQTLGDALAAPLQAIHGETACHETDVVDIQLPALQVRCYAEGTTAQVVLPSEPWRAAAERTPGDADDNLVALYALVYGAASPAAFPAWWVQTWDYGGCSALGTGKVVEVLRAADRTAAASGDLFAKEIAQLRAGALGELGEGHAQYCNPVDLGPMADTALKAEAQRILSEIRLSDAERQAVEAWMPKLVGEKFSGG